MIFPSRPYSVQPPELLARYPRTDHQVQGSADQVHTQTIRYRDQLIRSTHRPSGTDISWSGPRTDHQVQWSADQVHWPTGRKIRYHRQWSAIIDLVPELLAKKTRSLAQAVGLYIKICTILLHCPFKFKSRSSCLGMGPLVRERGREGERRECRPVSNCALNAP
jgi:hypothetical protein